MSDTVRSFFLPDLGEGLESATLIAWSVSVGDTIALNQPLCTVETAKAEVELPSPFAGVVVEREGEPGDEVPVGALLVRVDLADGATNRGVDVRSAERAIDAARSASAGGSDVASSGSLLVGYGTGLGADRSRRRSATAESPRAGGSEKPLAKPPVRHLARSLGIDLRLLAPGSGPGGIVTRADVLSAGELAEPGSARGPVPEADQVIPVRGVRARIAERMAVSRSQIPDATAAIEVECSRLLEVQQQLEREAQRRDAQVRITFFTLVCRLLVEALIEHPILNATFDADAREIRVHRAINLGFGTATGRGLVVPVVMDAGQLGVLALAQRMNALSTAARAGTIAPSELQGSTFTVSNFGALGLDDGVPVINHPEAAILGVGSLKERPTVIDHNVVARPTMRLVCAFDHRVCDGAEVGAFMDNLRRLVELPELLLLSL